LVELTAKAVDELARMRHAEGEHLVAALEEALKTIEGLLSEISAGLPEMRRSYRDRLTQRMNELLSDAGVSAASDDIAREAALFAERSDIAEELARVASHVEQFRGLMKRDEPTGRQLEFLVQEMFREANTMASKAGGVHVSRPILELKGQVDRLKEQVLNAE